MHKVVVLFTCLDYKQQHVLAELKEHILELQDKEESDEAVSSTEILLVKTTYDYLSALNSLFENGLLSHSPVRSSEEMHFVEYNGHWNAILC